MNVPPTSLPPGPVSQRQPLRVLTCGSVDDGESTLISRLLGASRNIGTADADYDVALPANWREVEREQGITTNVAYSSFSTEARSLIIADAQGDEHDTRNFVTVAAHCDSAILLVDARTGVLTRTRRHAYFCRLLGIRHVILAVNKIDLVGYDKAVFDAIVANFHTFAAPLGFETVTAMPVSARDGDNVVTRSEKVAWHAGPTLLEALETVEIATNAAALPFRFPVQTEARPHQDFRGFAGTVASGSVEVGDDIVSVYTGQVSKVSRIVAADADLQRAQAGDAVTLVLAKDIDIGRGDLLASPGARPEVSDQFAAYLVWMSQDRLLPGRSYKMRIGCHWTAASVTAIKNRIDVATMQHISARTLERNEIGYCNLATAGAVAFDPYEENRQTGSFILVDRTTNATVAAGMIAFGLRRATNIQIEALYVDKTARAHAKHQKPFVIWLTGLSGSGKSTIAKQLEKRLHEDGKHTYVLDGDNVRHGLNRDLGFTDADRVENIRRIGEVAKMFVDAGLIVLCSFISPFKAERAMVRELLGSGEFIEIFVDASLDECKRRDPKGLYAKVSAGKLKNFTGIDSPYEAPEKPDMHLDTERFRPDELVDRIIADLRARSMI